MQLLHELPAIALVNTGSQIAPIDISDVTGMNLWDINAGAWHENLLALTAGGAQGVDELKSKLGNVPESGGDPFGAISSYFVSR